MQQNFAPERAQLSPSETEPKTEQKVSSGKTPQQHKLEVANAINEILSKRILKTKSAI